MIASEYATLIFDCDGVVLDSNKLKTEAFRVAVLPWGAEATEALVAYHLTHGGVSRYAKFAHFFENIVPNYSSGHISGPGGSEPKLLLAAYAKAVRAGLLSCTVVDGLLALRAATPSARWLIVSGGDQAELRDVFRTRNLDHLFDGGVFGSPSDKHSIIERQLRSGGVKLPAVFFGDSRLDHEVAMDFGLDFVFVSQWTEFSGWREYCQAHRVPIVFSLAELAG